MSLNLFKCLTYIVKWNGGKKYHYVIRNNYSALFKWICHKISLSDSIIINLYYACLFTINILK